MAAASFEASNCGCGCVVVFAEWASLEFAVSLDCALWDGCSAAVVFGGFRDMVVEAVLWWLGYGGVFDVGIWSVFGRVETVDAIVWCDMMRGAEMRKMCSRICDVMYVCS